MSPDVSKRDKALEDLKHIHKLLLNYVGTEESANPVKNWLAEICARLYAIIHDLEFSE
jgi:hypothetical protein